MICLRDLALKEVDVTRASGEGHRSPEPFGSLFQRRFQLIRSEVTGSPWGQLRQASISRSIPVPIEASLEQVANDCRAAIAEVNAGPATSRSGPVVAKPLPAPHQFERASL